VFLYGTDQAAHVGVTRAQSGAAISQDAGFNISDSSRDMKSCVMMTEVNTAKSRDNLCNYCNGRLLLCFDNWKGAQAEDDQSINSHSGAEQWRLASTIARKAGSRFLTKREVPVPLHGSLIWVKVEPLKVTIGG